MNNIDKAGLLKQTHSGSSHTWIYWFWNTAQSWTRFISVRESKIKQTARRMVCFKGNHTMMAVYLQQHRFILYLQTIDRCDKLCMLL